jgi:hypothetical protein
MSSFGMCRRVDLTETDVSEEHMASIFRVRNQRTNSTLAIASDLTSFSSLIVLALKMEKIYSSETSVPTRTIRRHIPEDDILHCLFINLYGLRHVTVR